MNEEKICKNCKLWNKTEDMIVGSCECCVDASEMPDEDFYHYQSKFFTRDCEGYGSRLLTKEDFGCNEWREKE